MFNRLIFDDEFSCFLDKTSNNKISMLLLNGNNKIISEEGNFISRKSCDGDNISYFPKSKYKRIMVDVNNPSLGLTIHPWDDNIGRVKIKIGRFIRKFLSDFAIEEYNINDKDIENFVNIYKSFFIRKSVNLKIVEGEEILKWYLEDNYQTIDGYKQGTIWNSCMRQRERNKYLSMYSDNPNIKMLILLDDNGKLSARALLWNGVFDSDNNSYKVMDRIYTFYEHDVNLFKDWARENGYIYKMEQNAKSEKYFIKDNEVVRLKLGTKLDKWKFDYYPYLDTFKFFNYTKGILYNHDSFNFHYILVQSNGRVTNEEDEYENEDVDF